MPRSVLLGIAALIVFRCCAIAPAQTSPHQPAPQYGQPPEDLANALVQMARASHGLRFGVAVQRRQRERCFADHRDDQPDLVGHDGY
jgi:hypothetical protein